jgi:ElaB/YqjD/DUF883 family membrane-anchored ribosome-binding protein
VGFRYDTRHLSDQQRAIIRAREENDQIRRESALAKEKAEKENIRKELKLILDSMDDIQHLLISDNELAKKRYKELKAKLERLSKELENKPEHTLEIRFLKPAIDEAKVFLSSLGANRLVAKNKDLIRSTFYDAEISINFYLNQLK